jgi:hypothetical protein
MDDVTNFKPFPSGRDIYYDVDLNLRIVFTYALLVLAVLNFYWWPVRVGLGYTTVGLEEAFAVLTI